MLIVRLFTVNGNLYSTSFCISAILAWEFRSDSISRCFCCWRLVRPAGDPAAAEDDALLARGKSQLILLGSRPEAREGSGLLLSSLSLSLAPATEHGRPARTPRLLLPIRRARESPAAAGGTSFQRRAAGKKQTNKQKKTTRPSGRGPSGPLASHGSPSVT